MTPLESAFHQLASRHRHQLIAEAYDTLGPAPVLVLSLLNVRSGAATGTGTRFMEALCTWADQQQVTLAVVPLALGPSVVQHGYKSTSSGERLVQFYERFGFKSHKPRSHRIMMRPPQRKTTPCTHTKKRRSCANNQNV